MDTFRKQYKPLSENSSSLISKAKDAAEELEKIIHNSKPSREVSLALTNLEQCIMWATKAICLADE